MKVMYSFQVRAFPVEIMDERTGEQSHDLIVLDKERLQAAQLVGQSSKELIERIYNRAGFRVLDIGKADKQTIECDLEGAYKALTSEEDELADK